MEVSDSELPMWLCICSQGILNAERAKIKFDFSVLLIVFAADIPSWYKFSITMKNLSIVHSNLKLICLSKQYLFKNLR